MKITGDSRLTNLDAYVKNIREKKKADSFSDKGSREVILKDKVVLSPEAQQIQKVKELIDSLPDIRDEKVAEIRAQIEAGDYDVDGEKIASKMIEESLLYEMT
ncbi:MAG: flagellar biosynthesis anti-sigma factor FlgM [Deltaproteobacteria bacterium]|nr:flagellar biosynthesis anti-sigma factor FlgM [Deltaproteobacteria bacterium]